MKTSNSPPLLVTAAIIRCEGRVLLARRPLKARVEAGKWEFPGGKVEPGEQPEACLVREIREELDLDIVVDRYFDHSAFSYEGENPVRIVLLSYLCRVTGRVARPIEAEEIRWVGKDELLNFDFAAADIPLVHRLFAEWDQAQV